MAETVIGSSTKEKDHGCWRQFRPYDHELVPDRERFDLFLARNFDLLSPVPYDAMAAFESLPAWLRFLESKGLIDAKLRVHSLADLEGLAYVLCRALEQSDDDPSLVQACSRWRSQAGKPVPTEWKVQRRDL